MASELGKNVLKLLKRELFSEGDVSNEKLNQSLRLMCKWRSVLIQNTYISQEGTSIGRGPFSGMEFLEKSAEGCHVAKLLGTYEQPLHEHIKWVIKQPYQTIINIGCAEGYYAVGLAMKMPRAKVLAFDIDIKAQESCLHLAKKNGVADRLEIGGELKQSDLTHDLLSKGIIFCDIEGAELGLLDPLQAPAIKNIDIVVESHECLVPGVTEKLKNRFKNSHDIIEIQDDGMRAIENPPKWFEGLSHLDQLLATWEWRSGPTPWLIMKKK